MRRFSFDGEIFEVPEIVLPPVHANPLVSIVMTSRQRARQLEITLASLLEQTYKRLQAIVVEADFDGGETRNICKEFNVEYYLRENEADRRTSVANNIGIRRATGEIIVLQCAEIKHDTPDTIEKLIAPIIADPGVSTFPMVLDLNAQGCKVGWKHHPLTHPNCFITFCQAFSRASVYAIGGFDENYVGWGFEDNDFNFRLQYAGVKCRFVDAVVAHQWHETFPPVEASQSESYYHARLAAIKAGTETVVANQGKEWGDSRS